MSSVLPDTHTWCGGSQRLNVCQNHRKAYYWKWRTWRTRFQRSPRCRACGRLETAVSLGAWMDEIGTNPLLRIIPITPNVAAESVRLGDGFPRDPADQIIVATARCHGLRLMTADDHIRRWGKVLVV